jgi:hypothetical protein
MKLVLSGVPTRQVLSMRPTLPHVPTVPTRQVLVQGWNCLKSSYQSGQFFHTRTGNGLYTKVAAPYPANTGSYFIPHGDDKLVI